MPLSLAEEAATVVGIDPAERFQEAGVRLGRERQMRNLHFALADGMALPFAGGSFDLVLSHAVIEHVADAPLYLRECARVLAPGGYMYLSTSPYLSFAGSAPAAIEGAGSAASHHRPACGVRHVSAAGATRAVVVEGTSERELIHQGRTSRRGQGGRPPRKGSCRPAARSDCASRPPDRPGRTACHLDRPQASAHRSPDGCATARCSQDTLISNMEYVLAGR